ncbi:MAG: hypothetical protein LAP61_22970 [Acidobacteriia bacterium]|nr:hypothetical protein [Terriglobia bacterium]
MNFSLALAETPREITIDGTAYVLVRKAALDALLPARAAGDRTTRSPAARPASSTSRPAPKKKLKAPAPKPAARVAAALQPETSKPVSGSLRAAVLAEIQASPGRTSLELYDSISARLSTTSGSVYAATKSWVAKGLVEGKPTDEGTIGWHPRALAAGAPR